MSNYTSLPRPTETAAFVSICEHFDQNITDMLAMLHNTRDYTAQDHQTILSLIDQNEKAKSVFIREYCEVTEAIAAIRG